MLKDFTIANMLDMTQTIAGELFQGKTYPWEVLPEIGDFIVKLGKTLDPDEYDYLEGDIWIAKSAKVAPTACINGPAIIGKNTEVRHCAFIPYGCRFHLLQCKVRQETGCCKRRRGED